MHASHAKLLQLFLFHLSIQTGGNRANTRSTKKRVTGNYHGFLNSTHAQQLNYIGVIQLSKETSFLFKICAHLFVGVLFQCLDGDYGEGFTLD